MTTSPAEAIKRRLREDLTDALRLRRPDHMAILRTLIAAIDNAEAVPVKTPTSYLELEFGDPGAEAARRVLSRGEVMAVMQGEAEERESAALEMERVGRNDPARALTEAAGFVRRYVSA